MRIPEQGGFSLKGRPVLLVVFTLFSACSTQDPSSDPLAAFLTGVSPAAIPVLSVGGENGSSLERNLLYTISSARISLYCSFQDVNLPKVVAALRGASVYADVRIGIDDDNVGGPGYRQLAQFLTISGDDHRLWTGNSGAGQDFLNACIADKTRVFVSSAPPTVQGFYSETAFGFYFQDEETRLPKKFTVELELITHGSFGAAKQVLNNRNYWALQDMGVAIYMAPEDDPLEKFIIPRLRQARSSVKLYSSEFFSNELDGAGVRETTDLAYEILHLNFANKQIVGTMTAASSPDPNEVAKLNSLNYLSANGLPFRVKTGEWGDNGLNFLIVDSGTPDAQVFVSSHPFSTRADSSHDGFLFSFDYAPYRDMFDGFFAAIQAGSVVNSSTGTDIALANNMEVVISELNWMGGFLGSAGRTTEYIELYNNTQSILNLSGWQIQCGTGGTFAAATLTIPAGSFIAPAQYLVLTYGTSTSPLVQTFHVSAFTGAAQISDTTTQQCRLTDGVAGGSTVIDVIGANGTALSSLPANLGYFDSTNHIARSMERNSLTTSGANTTNWHTNSNVDAIQNINILPDIAAQTFGTPGVKNSQ